MSKRNAVEKLVLAKAKLTGISTTQHRDNCIAADDYDYMGDCRCPKVGGPNPQAAVKLIDEALDELLKEY